MDVKPLIGNPNLTRNQVARAMAKSALLSRLTTVQIGIYLMDEGAPCYALLDAVMHVLAVVECAMRVVGRGADPAARVINGGMAAGVDVAAAGFAWRGRHAVPLDQALERVRSVYPTLPHAAIAQAWVHCEATRRGK